jgi:nitrite reductase/ring-hydroxylating ferredoxin subunit
MPIKARCGRADEIPPGGSKVVQVRNLAVAIFNVAGTFYAVENTCPHQGGPLGEGYLEENGVISCPWHGWTFDLRTGVSPLDRDVRVGCYPVRVEEGLLVVELPG